MMSVIQRARALRKIIESLAQTLPDSDALEAVELFEHWTPDGHTYSVGDKLQDDGVLYKVLLAHVSQPSWKPANAPSLFVRVDNPAEEWPEWIQPLGATDAYAKDAKVAHNNKHWISNLDGNIWEPGIYGWSEV